MDFDPDVVSYNALLNLFWSAHNPAGSNSSRLYQKGIFTHNKEQAQAARISKAQRAKKLGRKVTSTIETSNFSLASESDQKYYLRHSRIWTQYLKHYPESSDITNSASATKANGYIGGNSHLKHFDLYADQLGLNSTAVASLRRKVPSRARHFVPQCKLPVE